jgi:hypothetical protein
MGETMAFWNTCLERNTTSFQNSNKITDAIVKTNDFSVIQIEVTFTNFIVENN